MHKTLDSQSTLLLHRKIIRKKIFLQELYKDFYLEFKRTQVPKGIKVELGSGAGFLKEVIPKVITSDIIKGPNIDRVFSASRIPLRKDRVAAFFMFNVLHHLKDPEKALSEMERCLIPGGKIVMIEPYNSLWGKFIYQNFHHENFDPGANWEIKGTGRLSDANGAIPWIIFVRDKILFEKKFSNLKIKRVNPHTPLRYLLSGGLSKPQLVPPVFYPIIVLTEKVLSPLNKFIAMFATIEIQKISQKQTDK